MNSLSAIFCLVAIVALGNAASPQQKPNIVMILADDLGWGNIGYNNDSMVTPNLNQLASEGIILDRFYASPMCSPTRTSLLTGRYFFRLGITGPLAPDSVYCVSTDEKLLPQHLQDLGYRTNLVGKWHIGHSRKACSPTERGFDWAAGIYGPEVYYFSHEIDALLTNGVFGKDFHVNDKLEDPYDGEYITNVFGNLAVERIEDHAANHSDEPMFLYLTFTAPHAPFETTESSLEHCTGFEGEDGKALCGMMYEMDYEIGRVVDTLKAQGMWDNTILLFSSDNGADIGAYPFVSNGPFLGGKLDLYEGGIRVPAFISGNGFESPLKGTRSQKLVHVMDFFNTMLHLAGQEQPGKDSVNLWDAITQDAPGRNDLVLFYSANGAPGGTTAYMRYLPDGRLFKYVLNPQSLINSGEPNLLSLLPDFNLFDLTNDPTETTNLAFTPQYGELFLRMQYDASVEITSGIVLEDRSLLFDTVAADPAKFNGFWGHFYDGVETISSCDYSFLQCNNVCGVQGAPLITFTDLNTTDCFPDSLLAGAEIDCKAGLLNGRCQEKFVNHVEPPCFPIRVPPCDLDPFTEIGRVLALTTDGFRAVVREGNLLGVNTFDLNGDRSWEFIFEDMNNDGTIFSGDRVMLKYENETVRCTLGACQVGGELNYQFELDILSTFQPRQPTFMLKAIGPFGGGGWTPYVSYYGGKLQFARKRLGTIFRASFA